MSAQPVERHHMTDHCVPIVTTIRRGPGYGRSTVYCTCGWDHTYTTRRKADHAVKEHLEASP